MENSIFAKAENITALTETTNNGLIVNYVEIPIEEKDETSGQTVVKMRKLRNEIAVSAVVSIEQFLYINSKSTKGVMLAISKLTKAHAESVGLKSVKQLLKKKFGLQLSDNTIDKYRRIGIIFSADRKDPNNYEYRPEIDPDTSVSNLDVVMTLFNLKEREIDLEKCSDSEIDDLFNDFYGKYIVLDKIHLLAPQSVLKAEVKEIVNPSITAEYKVLDESEGPETKEPETEEPDTEEPETEESPIESATHAIQILTTILKGNKDAEKALKKLADIVSTL